MMLADERTITPVIGRPPSRPETRLPAPCARNSLSRFERTPLCNLSVATAHSSDSMLAIIATVSTAITNGPQCSGGASLVSSKVSGRSTRFTSIFAMMETIVPVTTATSGPGMALNGSFFQTMRIATVSKPRIAACVFTRPSCFGIPSRFTTGELCGEPPSTTWICASAMEMPIPASIPCTTAGAMISAPRATLNQPSKSCTTPAQAVIKHIVSQPN